MFAIRHLFPLLGVAVVLSAGGGPAKASPEDEAKSFPAVATTSGHLSISGPIDDDCGSGGFDLGVLAPLTVLSIDTTGLADDFGCDSTCTGGACGTGCPGLYGGNDVDGVAVFTVALSGYWTFSTCGSNYDTSLQIRAGGACPGSTCLSAGDANCAYYCGYSLPARVTANLIAGNTYYLIVDGYSGNGGEFDIVVYGPCTTNAQCNDGLFCTGSFESCVAGQCRIGFNPCGGTTPWCDETTDSCLGCQSDPGVCGDDSFFCNGPGVCLPTGSCGQSGNPCGAEQVCDESIDACISLYPPQLCQTFRNSDFTLPGNYFPQCTNANCNTSPTGDYSNADDVELTKHSSRLVTSYSFFTQARLITTPTCCNNDDYFCNSLTVGTPYIVNTALFTVEPGTCFPGSLIPGSTCMVSPGVITPPGAPADIVTCDLSAPVLVPDGIDDMKCFDGFATFTTPCTSDADCLPTEFCADSPTSQCGVDFYIVMNSNLGSAGVSIGCTSLIGGPGLADEFADDVMVFATCTTFGQWNGWRFVLAGPGGGCPVSRGNWRGLYVCTEPTGACCHPVTGACTPETPEQCLVLGGTYLGEIQVDGSGGCSDGVDTDDDGIRDECDLCDNDPAKLAPGQCGCGNPDTDTDGDATADCLDGCPFDPFKTTPGQCGCGETDTDSDSDGTPDCHDGCIDDPNKTAPGQCGCGNLETGDSDGDTFADCVDQCPGVDDLVFAPGCAAAIPAASEWGLVIVTLGLLCAAKVGFGLRRSIAP